MLALLAVERIKLFSTRAPYWYLAVAAVSVVALAGLQTAYPLDPGELAPSDVLVGALLGQLIVMVLAVGSVTAEYRYGTIRASYLAVAHRWRLLVAKAATLAVIAFALGVVVAGLSLAFGALVASDNADIMPGDAAGWRVVLGIGPVYAVSAVLAAAVALLLRHAAGAIAALMVWVLLVETSMAVIPFGDRIGPLLPFQAMSYFLDQGGANYPYAPWFGLVYAAALAAGLFGLAVAAASKRDAA